MGDENPICTLGDYSKPRHKGYRNTIELLKGNNVVPLRFDTIRLVQNGCSFHGIRSDDPNQHLKDVLKLVALFEDLALYDNECWNDPRDFGKLLKAIYLPQDVLSTSDCRLIELENQVQHLMEAHLAPKQPIQANKITYLCEIYSGSHDPYYCMENPEQDFVKYASSHTDKAGGKWYTFKPEQNNLGNTYSPSWKSYPNLRTMKTNHSQKSQLQTGMRIGTQQTKEPKQTLEDELKDLHLNLPVLKVLAHAQMYNVILEKYVDSLELGKNGSAFIQGEIPIKLEDPILFNLPCRLGDSKPFDTLADLGACVNIIPLYLFKNLKIGLLEETDHVFGLADGTKSYPIGIVRDVEVHIVRLKLLNDFNVINMKKDPETPFTNRKRIPGNRKCNYRLRNHIRTLGDNSKPSHEGYRNTIELLEENNVVPLRSGTIRLVQNGYSFRGLWYEDPNQHLTNFLKLVDSLDLNSDNRERKRLRLFQFFLRGQASNWLERLPAGSISTWEDLTTHFLAQLFPPGRTAKLHNDRKHGMGVPSIFPKTFSVLTRCLHMLPKEKSAAAADNAWTQDVVEILTIAIVMRILMANSVIKVAAKFIEEVNALIIFPVIPYLILTVVYMFWLSAALHLFSSGQIARNDCERAEKDGDQTVLEACMDGKEHLNISDFSIGSFMRVPFERRDERPAQPRIVYLPILDINYFYHFLDILENYNQMDDEPIWDAEHVVSPTLDFTITIHETANEFAIKGSSNSDTNKTMARMDAMTMKMEARYKEMQSRSNHSIPEYDKDDKPVIAKLWKISQRSNKQKPKQISSAFLRNESSAMIQNKVRPKLGDPRTFRIPCTFRKAFLCNALADLGASINLMPYSLYAKLYLETLKPTKMRIILADRSFQHPIRIAENMPVEVGKFTFPMDFIILKMEEDSKVSLILGRYFLHITNLVIRLKQKQLNLGVGTKRMTFSIDSAMKHSYLNDDTCFRIDVIDEIIEEDFDALLNEGSEILYSIEGTILEEQLFVAFNEFMAMNIEENFESESETEEIPLKKSPLTSIIKSRHLLNNLL
nr:reverse transcriptase domain-containing protein [Tanacetum cinerariifolium]